MSQINRKQKSRVIILISGSGTNMEAVIRFSLTPESPYEVRRVIADRPCAGTDKAKEKGIPVMVLNRHSPDFSRNLLKECSGADFIVLAGFLSILDPAFIQEFPQRIINIHPSLLPAYGGKGMHGLKVHEAVILAGDKKSGCSCHLVSNEVDQGKVLLQKYVDVLPDDTPEILRDRILPMEHQCIVEGLLELIAMTKGEKIH